MKINRTDVFVSAIIMLICSWITGTYGSNISVELSIYCMKLTITLLAIWLCIDNK